MFGRKIGAQLPDPELPPIQLRHTPMEEVATSVNALLSCVAFCKLVLLASEYFKTAKEREQAMLDDYRAVTNYRLARADSAPPESD